MRRRFARTPSASAENASATRSNAWCAPVIRHNRLLVAFHVVSDAILGIVAFILAYGLRFHSGLIPITRGLPPLRQYVNLLPFIAAMVPLGFFLQGLYRLRRGRSRVDDFFAVFVGSILAVVFGVMATLYVQTYFASEAARDLGTYQVSQWVWAIFLVVNVVLTYASREFIREVLERRWRAGIGLKRILIAGSGDLGRLIADKILEHQELGYQIIGFVDDRAVGDHLGYRGLPLLGTLDEAGEITSREAIDHLYVALPPEQHVRMLELLDSTSREMVDVKVVPDLLQVIALRARLEDLDGVPVININDVPLQGFNTIVKRVIDIAISSAALLTLSIPVGLIAALVKLTSKGPVFYRQERMGLDGKSFTIVKFRSMYDDAERNTGPVWAVHGDARVTPFGRFLRKSNLDELPQLWNVLRGDMSIVGPRPERPHFVEQFKHKIPQYMLRHKVKSGLTGWAQVNGWRGNTPLEKRIEYDLYYIENWSVRLDLKIMWLTLIKGFFHKHAY
jgi:Undecaprenyl-phosphate glucose phosphotransferase